MCEDFVNYEQAVKLRKCGFDWICEAFYLPPNKSRSKPFFSGKVKPIINRPTTFTITAPTLWQAQKWLREVKEWDVVAIPTLGKLGKKKYRYYICHWNNPECGESTEGIFDSYEQAISAGIAAALELIE